MIKIADNPVHEIIEGMCARFVHGEHMTLSFWEVKQGAVLPLHSHPHEQITRVEEGEFELTVGDETHVYRNGNLAVIPPHVVHGGRALTDCKIFDIFSPVREDYRL